MKIYVATANNFCSYGDLAFKADSAGLTLISGSTGSGKSALCDLIPWVLFGVTAKNGAADEVLSWNGGSAQGTVLLTIKDSLVSIVRRRGKGQNDLFFNKDNSGPIRGKDLKDTQKLLNLILGVDAQTYLSGAYFHEFCASAGFFTTTAKIRRDIVEQVVDLSFHKDLTEKTKSQIKTVDKEITEITAQIKSTEALLEYLTKRFAGAKKKFEDWEKAKTFKLADLRAKSVTFDRDMREKAATIKSQVDAWKSNNDRLIRLEYNKIEALNNSQKGKCPVCGGEVHIDVAAQIEKHMVSISELTCLANPFEKMMIEAQKENNTYGQQADELEAQQNPHALDLSEDSSGVKEHKNKIKDMKQKFIKALENKGDLELLDDVLLNFRAQTVKTTILQLETKTNAVISEYFDGELRLALLVSGDDKLEVTITKDGNKCSYSQLSKGQRQILKLSFGIAVMEGVSRQHGIKFEQLFFDESLDGLDENLKIKAITLFEKLASERNSVYIVEHSSAVKSMVNKRLEVKLVDGFSQIEEA